MLLTIFTPTYNRGYCIENLYHSLCSQTSMDFQWIIVDDGSIDGTEEIVREFIHESIVDIKYIKQNNQGKHVAHNIGVKECKTELFFCVDSDDLLTPNAVEIVESVWKSISIEEANTLSGIVALKGHIKDKSVIGTDFPMGITRSTLTNLYLQGKKGDTALVFRTEVLREFPFPVFYGEKFLRESIAYDEIDRKYRLCVISDIIYLCEYREDGLSKNATQHELQSPKGAALYRLHEAKKARTYVGKIRNESAYLLFSIIGRNYSECFNNIGIKSIILLPIALFGYIKYKIVVL